MRVPYLASIFSACVIALCLAPPNYSQTQQDAAPPKQTSPAPAAVQDDKVDAIRLLYTGKTFGYFRIPDWQGPSAVGDGCKDPARQRDKSDAAAEFEELLKTQFQIDKTKGAILVGTGDNFAPEIEARDFCEPPAGQPGAGKNYQRVGKELFDWDANSRQWIRSDEHTQNNAAPANGIFMIPTDNVANFFIKEGYAALVPGKQDFYFGPERIRELARFMATQPIPNTTGTLHNAGQGVQMLGGNIVIETTWNTAHQPLPDSENPPWFIPRFPEASDLIGPADAGGAEIRLSGLSDGAKVYPWVRGVSLELSGGNATSKLLPIINSTKFYLCGVNPDTPGLPNSIPNPVKEGPCTVLQGKPGEKSGQLTLDFPWIDAQHFYTLHAGMNYGLCAVTTNAQVKTSDNAATFCVRFSVYTPFFQSSGDIGVQKCTDLQNPACYHDPDPYVLIETKDENGIPEDVAIFGVVDPQIGANVGLLNFAWANTANRNFKTETAIQDPAEAMKQMLDSFSRRFEENGYTKEISAGKRRLIKVLLAQMNSETAQILGTRLKQFQVVVSASDPEMATVGDTINTSWDTPKAGSVRHPMMIAIPEPYIVGSRNPQAVADIGRLDITISADVIPKWTLVSEHMEPGKSPDAKNSSDKAAAFWKAVTAALQRDCRQQGFDSESQANQIQTLTLCEMQKETHADVALLQKRDFFAELPDGSGDIPDLSSKQPDEMLQQLLDRIVWKGDFLNLLYVPGSALQQALKQSKAFDAADKSNLSVGENKNRGLVTVGITFDAAHNEYLIDGIQLNANKLYSVATSDYIGGGDTGFPDLAAAQIRPAKVPSDFDKQLVTISGAVCHGITGESWNAHCIGPIQRDTYLDEIAEQPANTAPSYTPKEELWTWTIFHHPREVPGKQKEKPPTLQNKMDQFIEYRPLLDFQLIKATFGVTTLGHNGSDAQIDANFGGITTPGVNSHRFTNWASDFQAQLTRNWKHFQLFASPSYTFNVQYKGQSNASRQINQIANLGMFDLGAARLWLERGPEHLDLVFTTHFETPLEETATAFTLKSTPVATLQFNQPRSYTTLVRGGIRWQRRISSIEFGPEGGHQWDALEGFNFSTNGKITATCLALSDISFSTCVANDSNSKITNPPTINANSVVSTLQSGKDHAGIYWKIYLNVPVYNKVSYSFTDTGDWFLVNFGTESTTDTRFRDLEQHQIKFNIFPSLSIGPELDLLFYENKSSGPLKGAFLRQDQVLMKAQFGFDLFNLRKKLNQIQYAPVKSQ
nr:5'-nucleotidase C-terminal domain-containing protein [Candidatus Acidoferrales bacterium]